ncbi:MAG: hypothetical protein ACREEM_05450 [Blastocatellia bacterium]
MLEITRENLRLRKLCFHFLLVASLLVLPGCFFTEINSDGSGVLTRLIVAPVGVDARTFCPQAGRGYTTNIDGRNCWATASFKNLSELRELIEAVKSPTVRINQLEKTGDGKFIVDLSVDAPEWPADYTGRFYLWSLKMPGTVTSHNAHRVDNGVLRWLAAPEQGVFRVHAESQVN